MKKLWIVLVLFSAIVSASFDNLGHAAAAGNNSVDIQILSPTKVRNYPGFETKVDVKITNRTGTALTKAMVYITMADLGKHWTVNLEDYSADKPVPIPTLAPGQSIKLSLPVRFVYTSHYKLYVTVSSDTDLAIYSSNAIPVEILGNTKINPTLVSVVAMVEPLLLLAILLFALLRGRKLKDESKD
ncbi:hypothetical protein ACQYAD_00775 [Neobacillus sp. SM06]|uniref:hypothetical protein n=1 Tax=Neobacillus sp. SM06 TaxID=3422492 RepID=UPI003D2A19D2